MRVLAFLALASLAALMGCGSPEASRTRGGGPGGDVGNRVERQGGSEMYYDTPVLIPERARGGAPAGGGARPSG